ncbi:MAG: hypothetical protein WCE90_09660 [Candidatus Zixiibacteriota bacterium]
MNGTIEKEDLPSPGTRGFACDAYPAWIVMVRWIILLMAFALGIYVLSDIREAWGVIYVGYALIALTLILPLSRCSNCFYHGKSCNTGWGKVAGYLFPKGDESKYVDHYSYAIFLHFLWLVPLLASIFQLLRRRDVKALVILVVFLFVLLLEKIVLRALACKRCHQREICPALPFRKK